MTECPLTRHAAGHSPKNYWGTTECFQKCPKASTKRDPTFQRCLCDASTPCLVGLSCVNGTCCSAISSDSGPQIVGGGPTDGNALFKYLLPLKRSYFSVEK